MRATLRFAVLTLCLIVFGADLAAAQGQPPPPPPPGAQPAPPPPPPPPPPGAHRDTFSANEIVLAGHQFFGTVSRGLAQVIEKAFSRWGEPNGYVLGQEGSGAFVVGLRYGDGKLYTRNAGDRAYSGKAPRSASTRRRRRPHHDARSTNCRRPMRSTSASPASTVLPISLAASA